MCCYGNDPVMRRTLDTFFENMAKENNYLLTGNKVALFSPRHTRDILLPERWRG